VDDVVIQYGLFFKKYEWEEAEQNEDYEAEFVQNFIDKCKKPLT
jgi:hypothetical protein